MNLWNLKYMSWKNGVESASHQRWMTFKDWYPIIRASKGQDWSNISWDQYVCLALFDRTLCAEKNIHLEHKTLKTISPQNSQTRCDLCQMRWTGNVHMSMHLGGETKTCRVKQQLTWQLISHRDFNLSAQQTRNRFKDACCNFLVQLFIFPKATR